MKSRRKAVVDLPYTHYKVDYKSRKSKSCVILRLVTYIEIVPRSDLRNERCGPISSGASSKLISIEVLISIRVQSKPPQKHAMFISVKKVADLCVFQGLSVRFDDKSRIVKIFSAELVLGKTLIQAIKIKTTTYLGRVFTNSEIENKMVGATLHLKTDVLK